jgi:hypothetical protein
VDAAPPCDETSTPDVEGCLVDNRYAVFVAAGSAAGDGTKEAPFGTIGEGVMAAKNRGATRVVVCNATYAEKLSLTQEVAGVNLFGGFTCPSDANGWAYTADERPLVNPTAGTALHVDGVTEAVTLQDIDFKSANATDPGTSSVAAIASGSTVTLKRVAITAGKGANGAKGADGSDVTPTPVTNAEQNGAGASCAMDAPFDAFGGNPPDPSTCGSHGGSGGDGQKIDLPGKPGDPGSPANPAPPEPDENGAGGPGAIGSGNAGDGKAGSRGADGIAGSKAMDSGFDAREN